MNATEATAAGAGFLRRLRAHAGDVLFLVVALALGFFLWPTSLGGCTTLTIVSGHSMEPTYYTGDLVVSRCGEYQVGDIVVYNPPNVGAARVIHRIVGGDAASGWVIQGDNNDFLDPWQPTDERVLGRAVLHLPKVGLIGSVLVSPITWVSLLLVAAALVIWPARVEEGDPEPENEPDGTVPGDPDHVDDVGAGSSVPEPVAAEPPT
jgi:signal peptidase